MELKRVENRSYVIKDSEKSDGNNESTSNVAFSTLILDITNCGTGQEHETENGQRDVESVRAMLLSGGEGSKSIQSSNENDQSVPQREWSMNEDAVPPVVRGIVLLQVVCYEKKRYKSVSAESKIKLLKCSTASAPKMYLQNTKEIDEAVKRMAIRAKTKWPLCYLSQDIESANISRRFHVFLT